MSLISYTACSSYHNIYIYIYNVYHMYITHLKYMINVTVIRVCMLWIVPISLYVYIYIIYR